MSVSSSLDSLFNVGLDTLFGGLDSLLNVGLHSLLLYVRRLYSLFGLDSLFGGSPFSFSHGSPFCSSHGSLLLGSHFSCSLGSLLLLLSFCLFESNNFGLL